MQRLDPVSALLEVSAMNYGCQQWLPDRQGVCISVGALDEYGISEARELFPELIKPWDLAGTVTEVGGKRHRAAGNAGLRRRA